MMPIFVFFVKLFIFVNYQLVKNIHPLDWILLVDKNASKSDDFCRNLKKISAF